MMRIIDRILLILFSFILIGFGLITFFMVLGWGQPLQYLDRVFLTENNRWIIGFSAVVIFIAGLAVLIGNISTRPSSRTRIITTEQGEVSISLSALENLVKKAAFQVHGVRDVKPLIKITPQGVAILIKAALIPGTVIPEAAQEIQTGVKGFLEQMAGLAVVEVKVLVTEVAPDTKGRLS